MSKGLEEMRKVDYHLKEYGHLPNVCGTEHHIYCPMNKIKQILRKELSHADFRGHFFDVEYGGGSLAHKEKHIDRISLQILELVNERIAEQQTTKPTAGSEGVE